jgi:hypothetical protein
MSFVTALNDNTLHSLANRINRVVSTQTCASRCRRTGTARLTAVVSAAVFVFAVAFPSRIAISAGNGGSASGSVDAAHFLGANAGVKIRAAINALGPNGGTVDARALTGKQMITSTITVPDKVTLLLGQAVFSATVVPVLKLGSNSRLIGEGALATPTEATLIQLADVSGGSAIMGGAAGVMIKSIHLKGVSTSYGSIGLDLQGLNNGWIAYNRIEGFGTGVRVGWPGNPWKCDCYNLFIDNQVVGAATGVNFDQSAYKNTWIGGNVQPFGTGGIGFRLAGGANVLFSPDVENFSHGIALDLVGSGNATYNLYAEAGGTVVQFEKAAAHNFVWGVNASSISADLENYLTSDKSSNIAYINNGVGTVWPYSWGAITLYFGQGSEPNYYNFSATQGNAAGGVNLEFTPGSQADKVYGLSGHAPFHVGGLSAEGISTQGLITTHAISDPSAPQVTPHGAQGGATYTYYVVCHDAAGGITLPSPAGQTARGNARLDKTNYNNISWKPVDGCLTWDLLKGATSTALVTGTTATTFKDTGQATRPYTPPTRNTTGDINVAGMSISKGIGWPLPTVAVNGASFYCPNCDPPASPPAPCTSSGERAGAWVHGLNNRWICVP